MRACKVTVGRYLTGSVIISDGLKDGEKWSQADNCYTPA
jgi:hypothetical protein